MVTKATQECVLSLFTLFLLCFVFYRSGDSGALQDNSTETHKVGTIKVVDNFQDFVSRNSLHKFERKYPSLPARSELWFFPPGDDSKGVLVLPEEDAKQFSFYWLPQSPTVHSNEAYVTLVGSNDHVLGARVLGRSIVLAGSNKDRVALVTNLVSDVNLDLLARDGWRVAVIPFIENPFIEEEAAKHLSFEERHEIGRRKTVLCKLHVWNLVEYTSVFYMDTDVIVVPGLPGVKETCSTKPKVDIDKVFDCGKNGTEFFNGSKIGQFCAFQYDYDFDPAPAWFFNAGIMVLKPSRETFRDILVHARWLGTNHNFGDQGTLARYFFYTCISEGKFLLGDPDKQDEVSRLPCRFPDRDYLSSANKKKLHAFKDLCNSVGTNVSSEMYMLLPPLFTTSGPITESDLKGLDDNYKFRQIHFWRGVNNDDSINKVYEANNSGCFQLDRPWQEWVSDDMHADGGCETAVLHYLDPDRKPWHWRLWPLAGYYSMWREVSDQLDDAWHDVQSQIFILSIFPILIVINWVVFLNSWFCGVQNQIRFESRWLFFKIGSCLRSVELPLLGKLFRLLYLPIPLKILFFLIPTPFDPLLCNWERISFFAIWASSLLGTYVSFQVVPSQLPPLIGWILFIEWSSCICFGCVVLWAFLMHRVVQKTTNSFGGQATYFYRWVMEPIDKQTKSLIMEGLKLVLVQVVLEGLEVIALMAYGRHWECEWWDLKDHVQDFFFARVLTSWLFFVRAGLHFLRKFTHDESLIAKELC